MRFKRIVLEGWRQFDNVDIELHDKLTIITGSNGSGKSTILSLVIRHFGWQRSYLSVPKRDKNGQISYAESLFSSIWSRIKRVKSNDRDIGAIHYDNGYVASIILNPYNSVQYDLNIVGQQTVMGFHIDSYRPTPFYQTIPNIPMSGIGVDQAFSNYNQELLGRFQGAYYSQSSPIMKMKEALISMAIFGEGNSAIGKNDVLKSTYDGFNAILSKILPESLGFQRIAVRAPEVVLVTKSGEFMIDASSGGIMTLIDISWRLYMYSIGKDSFTVTLDEPENHLHPSMQRSLMRRLIDAFPNVQFIVATHSPFIVSSVKDSNVYVLRYRERDQKDEGPSATSRVYSQKLNQINKAASAGEILQEVLGVPATMPEWVEVELSVITDRYRNQTINQDMLNALRRDLKELGFAEYYPSAIAAITANR